MNFSLLKIILILIPSLAEKSYSLLLYYSLNLNQTLLLLVIVFFFTDLITAILNVSLAC